ncbi:hypothetical protein HanPI659440_Chr07g0277461 [Helianthus annuus]|nr:hypothetical protein HanPI659440_Chr07g0277461 [Helianthus annuus]
MDEKKNNASRNLRCIVRAINNTLDKDSGLHFPNKVQHFPRNSRADCPSPRPAGTV